MARVGDVCFSRDREGFGLAKMKTNLKSADGRSKKIFFFGHFGSPNFGNEFTLQTILYHLQSRLPEAKFVCICTGPEVLTATRMIEAVPIRRAVVKFGRPRNRLARWLRRIFIGMPSELCRWLDEFKTLKGADALIVPGTGLLNDAYGLLDWGPYGLFKWSLMAKMRRCKLLFVSVGAGPLYGALGRYFVKSALTMADFRSYRDNASMNYLKGIEFPTNGDRIYPDLVFSLPEAMLPHDGHKTNRRPVVGLGLMVYAGRYSVEQPSDAIYQAYLRNLVAFAGWLLEQGYDIRLIIGEVADKIVSEEFKSRLRAYLGGYEEDRVIDEPANSAEELLPQIAATDFIVATRFHNLLIALLLNKPTMAISFHHKCASLMSELGLADYCHDINQMNVDRLIEQFQDLVKNSEKLKPVIRQKVEQFREALDEQYSLIFKCI